MMNRKNILFIIGILIAGSTFVSWLINARGTGRYEYETEVVQVLQNIPPISVTGTITSPGQTPLYTKTDGVVKEVRVKPGDQVKKGDVLASLDVDEQDLKRYRFLSALEKEITNEHNPYKTLNSIRKLSKQGFFNAMESEDAKNQVLRTARDYLALQTAIDDYEKRTEGKILRAPYDGIVSEMNWKVGEYISASRQVTPGASIYRPGGKIEAKLEVPDEVISYIKIGQKSEVSLPISRNNTVSGIVTNVTPSVISNEKTRYFLVTVELDKPLESVVGSERKIESTNRDWIRLGMRVIADIYTKTQDQGIWIPRAAVDLEIPMDQVSGEMSFVYDSQSVASRDRSESERSGAETLKIQDVHKTVSVIGRTISSEVTPLESKLSSIYILNSSGKVIKAQVKVLSINQDKAFVTAANLEGYRIITHYKSTKSLSNVLGSPQ